MHTILLLTISNIFMTFAWYGHLKYKESPLWLAILASWGIAFVEYCFQVPANRIGHYEFTAAQLKTIQEVITLERRKNGASKAAIAGACQVRERRLRGEIDSGAEGSGEAGKACLTVRRIGSAAE